MNILKHIVSLIFLIFGNLAFADAHYVRACDYNGDGSSADCAKTTGDAGPWGSFESIDWQSIEPADTLYIIGEHNEKLTIKKSGTENRKITIKGNKRGYDYDKGIINGNGDTDICVYDNDSSNNLRFTHLEVTGCTKRGFYFRNGMNISNFSGITLYDVYVHDIIPNIGEQDGTCVWGYGEKLSVKRSRFDNCGDDAIWTRGKGARISHNTMKKIGTGDNSTGDCVQLSGNSTNFVIKNNYCDNSSNPEKQCFIVNNTEPDETAGGKIIDNVCLMGDEETEMNSNGIYNNQHNVIIARNFVYGGRQSIWNTTNSNTKIVSNVLTAFDNYGIVNFDSVNTMSIKQYDCWQKPLRCMYL